MIKFQFELQEQYGNYWKKHGIVWRRRTMLQAAFAPYLPPLASYLPASLTYTLAKPCWGSQIICVIKFIFGKANINFYRDFFHTSECYTGIRI